MNIPLSLLVYNFAEACSIMLLCDIITGNITRIDFKNFWIIYLFGSVNFAIQYVPNFVYGRHLFIVLQCVCEFVLIPVSIHFFYGCFNNITTRQCFIAQAINVTFILVISAIFDLVFKTNNLFVNEDNLSEFIINVIIFSVQIICYIIIRRIGKNYEEHCKGYRK